MRAELEGLSPSARGVWYRSNVQEILGYYAEHGAYYTMKEFNMKDYTTLENFIRHYLRIKVQNTPKHDADEKLAMRIDIVAAGVAEVRKETRLLRDSYDSFVPTLADTIAKKYIVPGIVNGLMQTIKLPEELEDSK